MVTHLARRGRKCLEEARKNQGRKTTRGGNGPRTTKKAGKNQGRKITRQRLETPYEQIHQKVWNSCDLMCSLLTSSSSRSPRANRSIDPNSPFDPTSNSKYLQPPYSSTTAYTFNHKPARPSEQNWLFG